MELSSEQVLASLEGVTPWKELKRIYSSYILQPEGRGYVQVDSSSVSVNHLVRHLQTIGTPKVSVVKIDKNDHLKEYGEV